MCCSGGMVCSLQLFSSARRWNCPSPGPSSPPLSRAVSNAPLGAPHAVLNLPLVSENCNTFAYPKRKNWIARDSLISVDVRVRRQLDFRKCTSLCSAWTGEGRRCSCGREEFIRARFTAHGHTVFSNWIGKVYHLFHNRFQLKVRYSPVVRKENRHQSSLLKKHGSTTHE